MTLNAAELSTRHAGAALPRAASPPQFRTPARLPAPTVILNTILSGAMTGARGLNRLLDTFAPGHVYHNAGHWLTGALALTALGNVAARPQALHGGNYLTEAQAGWNDVGLDIQRCINERGGQSWPAKNVVAYCVADAIADACGRDSGCQASIDRTLADTRERLAAVPGDHYDVLSGSLEGRVALSDPRLARQALHDRFKADDGSQQVLAGLQERVESSLGEQDIAAPAHPYRWNSLLTLLSEDSSSGPPLAFLRGAAHRLGNVYRSIAKDLYLLEPALLDDTRAASLGKWIDQQYPGDPADALDAVQTTRVLKDLAVYLNHKYPVIAAVA